MADVTLPGSVPAWNGSDPAWQNGIAQLAALGSPLGNIGSLGQAGIRALALVPSVMASASGGGQDTGGLPGAIANAAMADFRGPLAGRRRGTRWPTPPKQSTALRWVHGCLPSLAQWTIRSG